MIFIKTILNIFDKYAVLLVLGWEKMGDESIGDKDILKYKPIKLLNYKNYTEKIGQRIDMHVNMM